MIVNRICGVSVKSPAFADQLHLFYYSMRQGSDPKERRQISSMAETVAQWLLSLEKDGMVVAILVNTLLQIPGFIPSVTITGVNVFLWGPVLGGIVSWLGEVLGAGAAFFFFRTGYRIGAGRRFPDWRWINHLNRWPPHRQFISLLAARLAPMIPSGAINLLGSLTTIRFQHFLLATAIGKIPSIALEVWVSHDLIHVREHGLRLAMLLIALVLVRWLWKRKGGG